MSIYKAATEQTINLEKSAITFGERVEPQIKESIQLYLGISKEGGTGNYLGLPECFSGSKVKMLAYIKEKLNSRISGWFARTLSLGGKEVLLKSVALAMPIYAMSCFKLSKTTCSSLSSAMADFWWQSTEDKRKVHWISWDKLCLTKQEGGMGFRDIECFNQALLGKQAWRIIQNPNSLCASFLKSRYHAQGDFIQAVEGSRPSYGWRSILHGRALLMKGMTKLIGDGSTIKVWCEPWIGDGLPRIPLMKNIFVNLNLKVSDLIHSSSGRWNKPLLKDLFFQQDIELILRKRSVVSQKDYWIWNHNRSGDYSVKSGNWLANREKNWELTREAASLPSLNGLKAEIWTLKAPSKIKNFFSRAISGAVPVVEKILTRGINLDDRCQTCGMVVESINHVLFACTAARQVWALSEIPGPKDGFESSSIYSNIAFLLSSVKKLHIPIDLRRSIPWIVWQIWKNRNSLFFEGKRSWSEDTIRRIREEALNWFMAQVVENEISQAKVSKENQKPVWKAPPANWIKCNSASSWSKETKTSGGAWVIRDSHGKVLMHSRRSFGNIQSRDEANLHSLCWTLKSLKDHHLNKVIIASQDHDLLGAILRPKAWPSFTIQGSIIKKLLLSLNEWRIQIEEPSLNRGAYLIAQSVTRDDRRQSYVSIGTPGWLIEFFDDESSTSV